MWKVWWGRNIESFRSANSKVSIAALFNTRLKGSRLSSKRCLLLAPARPSRCSRLVEWVISLLSLLPPSLFVRSQSMAGNRPNCIRLSATSKQPFMRPIQSISNPEITFLAPFSRSATLAFYQFQFYALLVDLVKKSLKISPGARLLAKPCILCLKGGVVKGFLLPPAPEIRQIS